MKFLKVKGKKKFDLDEYDDRKIELKRLNSGTMNSLSCSLDEETLSHQIIKMNLYPNEIIKAVNNADNIVGSCNFKKKKIKN